MKTEAQGWVSVFIYIVFCIQIRYTNLNLMPGSKGQYAVRAGMIRHLTLTSLIYLCDETGIAGYLERAIWGR